VYERKRAAWAEMCARWAKQHAGPQPTATEGLAATSTAAAAPSAPAAAPSGAMGPTFQVPTQQAIGQQRMTAYLPGLTNLVSAKAQRQELSTPPPFLPGSAFPAKEVLFKQITPAVLRELYMSEARILDGMLVCASN
jgi:hypothetical protein